MMQKELKERKKESSAPISRVLYPYRQKRYGRLSFI